MAVVQTFQWFRDSQYSVEGVMKNFPDNPVSKKELESILIGNGLNPYRSGQKQMESLQERKVWRLIERYYQKYKKIWNGPDIPIYILPFNTNHRQMFKNTNGKSGVAFPGMLFLFLSDQLESEEMEALFVHEYHHVCRFRVLKRKVSEFTLLDSVVMEGLAEHAVMDYCGEKYIAKWNRQYSDEQLRSWWKRWFIPNLSTKKEKNLHNSLLYGRKFLPMMVGYSVGFFLISEFRKKQHFSTKTFIGEPAETFMLNLE